MPTFTALNGRLPASVLTGLPWAEAAGFRLRADAAASAGRLAAAFRAHFNAPLLLTDAYRLFATQVALKASKGAWAAEPGTSNHGLGIAIDFASGINVDGSVQHRWMEANGPSFGWINPPWATNWNPLDGQHEPWHWEYAAAGDQHIPAPTPPPAIPTSAPTPTGSPQEDDMLTLITWSYANLMGRDPSTREVLDRLGDFNGWSAAQVRDWFLATRAEPGTVVATFREFLGHDPNPAQVTEWSSGKTVRQVRDGIAGSPEALARK